MRRHPGTVSYPDNLSRPFANHRPVSTSMVRRARQARWSEETSSLHLRLERVEARGQVVARPPKYHESIRDVLGRMRGRLAAFWRKMPFIDAHSARHNHRRSLGSSPPPPVGLPLGYQPDVVFVRPPVEENDHDLEAVPRRALEVPRQPFQRYVPTVIANTAPLFHSPSLLTSIICLLQQRQRPAARLPIGRGGQRRLPGAPAEGRPVDQLRRHQGHGAPRGAAV